MTAIFTKGDVKRKFVTIEFEDWSDIADLQKEIDLLESKRLLDCRCQNFEKPRNR